MNQPVSKHSREAAGGYLFRRAESAGLGGIAAKLAAGKRLSFDDGMRLYEFPDTIIIGALANLVRERMNDNRAYFNRNLHINYTNVCNKACEFCAFGHLPGQDGGYTLSGADVEERLRRWDGARITEVHMVGGVNPALPFSYFIELLGSVRSVRPDVHIKAFTMVELAQMIRISGLGPEETILALKEAGLGSCPGGGAEVLSDRVHQQLFPRKTSPSQWLDLQRLVHRCGLRSNATMLYGHMETLTERVEHLVRLRELQDETGGFQAFIPLAFHPENTRLSQFVSTTGFEDLRNIAVARLMLDNFPHIKAFWIMISPRLAQVSLSHGADDMDGTVLEERITHDAGARTPRGLAIEELVALILETGRVPVERDTLYNVVRVL